ncbi:phosphatase PAP2 family protein [bacterium]|nr:phosphatase PAP2 family protein [bacterium]
MNRCKLFMLVLCLGFLYPGACSQAQEDDVFQIDRKKETIIMGGGVFLFSVGSYLIYQMDPVDASVLDRERIFYPDRFAADCSDKKTALFSDMTCGLCIGLPMISVFTSKKRTAFYHDMIMYIESMLYIQGITFMSKAIFKRPRPNAYQLINASDKSLDIDAVQSFFSGHTALAFNGAVFAATVFQRRNPHSSLVKPAWILGISSAVATGLFRVTSGNHFPTDVFAGALVGTLTGWIIPYCHEHNDPNKKLSIMFGNCTGICYHF